MDSYGLRTESSRQTKHERKTVSRVLLFASLSNRRWRVGERECQGPGVDQATMIREMIREKLHEKKAIKVLIKWFQEDDEQASMGLSK